MSIKDIKNMLNDLKKHEAKQKEERMKAYKRVQEKKVTLLEEFDQYANR